MSGSPPYIDGASAAEKVERDEFDAVDSIIRTLQLLALYKLGQTVAQQVEGLSAESEDKAPVDTDEIKAEIEAPPPSALPGSASPQLPSGADPSPELTGTPTAPPPALYEGAASSQLLPESFIDVEAVEVAEIQVSYEDQTYSGTLTKLKGQLQEANPLKAEALNAALQDDQHLAQISGDASAASEYTPSVEVMINGERVDQLDRQGAASLGEQANSPAPAIEAISLGEAERLTHQNPGDSYAQNPDIATDHPTPLVLVDPKTNTSVPLLSTRAGVETVAHQSTLETASEQGMWRDIKSDRALEVDRPGTLADIESDRAVSNSQSDAAIYPAQRVLGSLPGNGGRFEGEHYILSGTSDNFSVFAKDGRGEIFHFQDGNTPVNHLSEQDVARFHAGTQIIEQHSFQVAASNDVPVPRAQSQGSEIDIG
ncbi:MAG: hypothetical protein AAFY26_19450 [Cyanobacteria bacterium J06638_22]